MGLLLESGAMPNVKDRFDNTPLYDAVRFNHLAAARMIARCARPRLPHRLKEGHVVGFHEQRHREHSTHIRERASRACVGYRFVDIVGPHKDQSCGAPHLPPVLERTRRSLLRGFKCDASMGRGQ